MTDRSKVFRIGVRKFGPFESAIQKAWQGFADEAGIDLQLDAKALDLHPLEQAFFEREELKAGKWDVAFLPTDWVAQANESGAVLDLAPMIAANPPPDYPDGWTESLLRMQRFGDRVIGLPYHDGPEVFIYRTDLFNDRDRQAAYQEQYGVELKPPETWEEFQQIARFFTDPEADLYGTAFAAYPDGHNTVYDFCLQLWTRGGEVFDSNGRMNLQTPEAEQALTFYRQMLNDSGAVHPKSHEMDSVQSGFAFARGEVAMMINWFGFAAMAETIEESNVKGRISIGPIPHAPGKPSASLNVYWILAIGAGSPHTDIAYQFLRYCTRPEVDRMLTLEGATGCRRSTWNSQEVNDVVPFYHRLEALHSNARELPRLSNWGELAAVIDGLVVDTIDTDRPIRELLAQAQQKADQLQE